jgi:hypothetical protein
MVKISKLPLAVISSNNDVFFLNASRSCKTFKLQLAVIDPQFQDVPLMCGYWTLVDIGYGIVATG